MVIINLEQSLRNLASVKVSNQLLDCWGVTFEEVYHKAYLNLLKEEVYIDTLANAMSELGYVENDDFLQSVPMYILSNQNQIHGATMMLREHILNKLAQDCECDLFIIPSSLHEILIVPQNNLGMMDVQEMNEMVQTVNQTGVADAEILSDHVYLYKRDGGWYNLN